MNTNEGKPETLMEAVKYYADLDVCYEYMLTLKWPDGVIKCPKCGSDRIGKIASRRMFQCKEKWCHKQFSVKVGTIFEDSALGLDKWFVAVWCVTNAKNGISSCELARAIGIQQKHAWHMLHRIRHAMHVGSLQKFTGEVETDESFIGGKAANMHLSRRREKVRGTGHVGKTIVHGIIERSNVKHGSKVKAKVVPNVKVDTLIPIVQAEVASGSHVYTDAMYSYNYLPDDFIHEKIDHAVSYVRGKVHTNGMENFWSLLKRAIHGTYVSVDAPHLGRYVDEQVFRFNERERNDAGRFAKVMPGIVGKKLTYKTLIGAATPDNCKKDAAASEGLAN